MAASCLLALMSATPVLASPGAQPASETETETVQFINADPNADTIAQGPALESIDIEEDIITKQNSKTEDVPAKASGSQGESLGTFKTTAYCTCTKCTSGSGKTYSGTIPKAKHTISADLDMFPIGTKLMINDIIYTVEDCGVSGYHIDLYFDKHEDTAKYGVKNVEVFSVVD